MSRNYEEFLICDDLIFDDIPTDKLLVEKIPELKNAKVISGTFGKFNINELPEPLRKRIDAEWDIDWKSLYQQEPIEYKGKPYRCICHSLDIRFGQVIDLQLSMSVSGRMIIAKCQYTNKFKKTYENYGDFLKDWEEVE